MTDREPLLYIVQADFADPEREDGFNQWYTDVHVPELLSVPGFLSGRRFRDMAAPNRYLAAYELADESVFDHPRYTEVTGWREWGRSLPRWSGKVYRHTQTRAALEPGDDR